MKNKYKQWRDQTIAKHDDLSQVLLDKTIDPTNYIIEYTFYDKFERPMWLITAIKCSKTKKHFIVYEKFKDYITKKTDTDK